MRSGARGFHRAPPKTISAPDMSPSKGVMAALVGCAPPTCFNSSLVLLKDGLSPCTPGPSLRFNSSLVLLKAGAVGGPHRVIRICFNSSLVPLKGTTPSPITPSRTPSFSSSLVLLKEVSLATGQTARLDMFQFQPGSIKRGGMCWGSWIRVSSFNSSLVLLKDGVSTCTLSTAESVSIPAWFY